MFIMTPPNTKPASANIEAQQQELQMEIALHEQEELSRAKCVDGVMKIRERWGRSMQNRSLSVNGVEVSCKK
jgi:hypothetical protein